MNNDAEHDVRLVYYACAYILAHRGHFLFNVSKKNIDEITYFTEIYKNFYKALTEIDETPPFDENAAGMAEILRKHINQSSKDKEFKGLLFGGKAPKDEEAVIKYDSLTKIISGGKVKLSDLFCKEDYKELEKNSVCVKNADFEDTLDLLTGQIDESHLSLLASIKAMYEWSLLEEILSEDTAKYEVMGHKKQFRFVR